MSSTMVSSAEIGAASGFLGLGLGYVFAPQKYNLPDLLTMKADVFEKAVPEKVLAQAENSQKSAHAAICDARKILAGTCKNFEGKFAELLKNNQPAYETLKCILPKPRVKCAIITAALSGVCTAVIDKLFNKN